jgi:histone-lysine N-methyltransferase SETMAR
MFDRVITGDETRCFQYDPETKRNSMQWKTQNSPRPKRARMSRSQFKTTLVCFFDHKRIVHHEFIASGQTVNQQCYLEVLTRLRESVRRKRPEIWRDKWILHHDNIPALDALRVREFLANKSFTKMDHSPYSPDLVPCDFWLFPKLNNDLKAQRFADIPDIQQNVTLLRSIPENDFQDCFRQLHHHLTKCMASQESISKATAAASAQVNKFCFPTVIPGIKLSHYIFTAEHSAVYKRSEFEYYIITELDV